MNNSSLLNNASPYDKKPINPIKLDPDTFVYSSQFYAKNHVPSSQERPGNNTTNPKYSSKYNENYNLFCYNS